MPTPAKQFVIPHNAALLAALTKIAARGGLDALESTLGDHVHYRPGADPQHKLRRMAARSRDPAIRLSELSARRRRAEQRDGDLIPFPTRPDSYDTSYDSSGVCESCGWAAGADIQDATRCAACGARGTSATIGGRSATSRRRTSRDPRVLRNRLDRQRIEFR